MAFTVKSGCILVFGFLLSVGCAVPAHTENGKLGQKPETLFVGKTDGSKQCGMGDEISLEEMQAQLGSIRVYSAKKGSDGLIRVTLCGAPTGALNLYEINKSDLEAAKSMGFRLWESKETR